MPVCQICANYFDIFSKTLRILKDSAGKEIG